MRIVRAALCAVLCAAALAGISPPANAQNDRWAAVAVSTHPGKDAFAFQYNKDSEAGAIMDVVAICERILAERGFRDGRCIARASTDWVIGMYCRNGPSSIGVGRTPAEATADALQRSVQSTHCNFVALRHGTHDRAMIRDEQWTASMECNGRIVPGIGVRGTDTNNAAIVALNQAFLNCGAAPQHCKIVAFDSERRFSVLRQ